MTEEKLKLIQPQEIEAWYILPIIRKELALAMKAEGLDQQSLAKLLGITPAAVSQYVNNKRASDYTLEHGLKKEFTLSAKQIVDDNTLIFSEVQRLLKILWDQGIVCEIHQEKSWCPDNCEVCLK